MENLLDLSKIVTLDSLLQVYLLCKLIDYLTGFLKAYKVEGFKSSKLRMGILNFVAEILALFFVGTIDLYFKMNMVLLGGVKSLFVFKECVSIVENLSKVGVNLPQSIVGKIQEFKQGEEMKNDKKDGEE